MLVALPFCMSRQIEFLYRAERAVLRKRCLTPVKECVNPMKRDTP